MKYYSYLVSYSALSNTYTLEAVWPFDQWKVTFGCLLFMPNKQNNHHTNLMHLSDMSRRESLMALICHMFIYVLESLYLHSHPIFTEEKSFSNTRYINIAIVVSFSCVTIFLRGSNSTLFNGNRDFSEVHLRNMLFGN